MTTEKPAGEGQYLTFKLGGELYAVEITKVREVLDYTRITRVPRAPGFMKGVINLRGGVVPVVDFRLKFGMAEAQPTPDTCIIIMDVAQEGELAMLGALADQVHEVLDLSQGDVVPPPRMGTRVDVEFILGMGKHNDDFITILDIGKVFSLEELMAVQPAAAPPKTAGQTQDKEMHDKETHENEKNKKGG